ncbi:MAG: ATP-binding protein [Parvularculaceae bacterium]
MDAPLTLAERVRRSLSAKLLLMTVLFVLLAELIVLVPSISDRRIGWFKERLEAAYLVGLALDAPDQMIEPAIAEKLFETAGILGVTVDIDGARMPVRSTQLTPDQTRVTRYVNLGRDMPQTQMAAAWMSMLSEGDHAIRVVGRPANATGVEVDMFVSQAALRRDLQIFARNVLFLSLIISSLTAGLVFWSLSAMIVRPVKRITRNMMAFENNPEDAGAILAPSRRTDEIGVAERSLASLEQRLQTLLSERRRLAALGAGISKISHDLRNILASAQLMSDRLAKSEDPRVRKLSPRLIAALDRAIALSRDTLSYARMDPSALKIAAIDLHALVDDVFDDCVAMEVTLRNEVAAEFSVHADATQLYRALFNLVKNAVEALSPQGDDGAPVPRPGALVCVRAQVSNGEVAIDVEDNGAGLPQAAIDSLFEPFKGSLKPGGSGLGVAIALEIARAHRGGLTLAKSDGTGATFRLTLPAMLPPTLAITPGQNAPTPLSGSRGSAAPSKAPS